jgi:hypothetical protein
MITEQEIESLGQKLADDDRARGAVVRNSGGDDAEYPGGGRLSGGRF